MKTKSFKHGIFKYKGRIIDRTVMIKDGRFVDVYPQTYDSKTNSTTCLVWSAPWRTVFRVSLQNWLALIRQRLRQMFLVLQSE
jgi:hypothetical protein